MKKCEYCAEEIQDEAKVCKHCGVDFKKQQKLDSKKKRKGIVKWIIVIFFIFFVYQCSKSIVDTYDYSTGSTNIESNVNSIITWKEGEFVDEFGDATGEKFLLYTGNKQGTFSNTATTNSRLDFSFRIIGNLVNVRLYEYGGKTPVQNIGNDKYKLSVKDSEGNKHDMNVKLRGDSFDILEADKIISILKKGGDIQFVMERIDFPTTYKFNLNSKGLLDILK